jgi:DNA-binding GntR family transcriptional regulator
MYNMTLAETLPRRSLRDEVFETLHNRVIAGEYRPGEWLRQDLIASQLGVSMTPVREALNQLVAAGLAERVPYRGVRVVELTQEEMLDAYGLRLLLEPAAVRLASERADQPRAEELKRIHARTLELVALSDMSLLRQLSREFHALVVEMSGDPLLVRLYQIVANKFPDWMLYEAMFRHPDELTASLAREQEEHSAILASISDRQPAAASRAATSHILSLGKDLQTYLSIPAELIREKERQFVTSPLP